MKKLYKVLGMTCNGCRATVEEKLNNLSDVQAHVNLENETAELDMSSYYSLDELQAQLGVDSHYSILEMDA